MTLRRLPDPREKPWLTVAELAAITGEGQKAIRAALAADQLPELRLGRLVRIPTALLLARLGIEPALEDSEADPATGSASASIHVLATKTGDSDCSTTRLVDRKHPAG